MMKKKTDKIFNTIALVGALTLIISFVIAVFLMITTKNTEMVNEILAIGGLIVFILIAFIMFPLSIILVIIEEKKENSKKES